VPQQELLKSLVEALDSIKRPYFITGSIASSLQGEPRATHDIDVIVSLLGADIPLLEKAFQFPRYHFDPVAAQNAVRTREMFNVIFVEEGLKIDFWVMKDEPFNQSRMQRRKQVDALGIRFWVSSPEDTILAKLRWAKLSGGSEKQFRDALRVFEVQAGELDMKYLDEWAVTLGVEDLLARIRKEARSV